MRRVLLSGLMAALLLATASISTASAQVPGLEPIVSDLSETDPNGPSVWQAAYPARASQVAAMLPGLDVLWHWNGQRWQPYATRGGRLLPGAVNFTVETGDRLWIGNWDAPEPAIVGVVIAEGHRAGLIANRNVVGDPDAPVLITDYSDFL